MKTFFTGIGVFILMLLITPKDKIWDDSYYNSGKIRKSDY